MYLLFSQIHDKIDHIFEPLLDSSGENPIKQLKNFIHGYLGYAYKFGNEVLTLYSESRHLKRDSLRSVLSRESKKTDCIEALIIRGVNQGYFNTKDTNLTANMIQYMLVIQAIRGWNLNKYSFSNFEELVTELIFNLLQVKEEHRR